MEARAIEGVRSDLRALAAGALAAGALLSGSPSAAAPACGNAVIPVEGAISSLHPLLTHSVSDALVYAQLFRPMLWFAHDGSIDFANSQASSIDVSADRTVFRVRLKPWRWSDGAAVTADDIVYAVELIRGLGRAYFNDGVGGVPGLLAAVTSDGPLTLVVRTTRPVNVEWFEALGLMNLLALPRHAWGGIPLEQQRRLQTDRRFLSVVDGPFRLADYRPGQYVVLAPNPAWSGRPATIARLVVRFVVGGDALTLLRAGELDAALAPISLLAAALALPGYRAVSLRDDEALQYFAYNFANPSVGFFRDVRVRQAIADAVNQQELIAVVDHGRGAPVLGPVPTAMTGYLSPDARAGRFPVGYDPAHAEALLAAAGFSRASDGVMQRQGVRLQWTDLLPAGFDAILLTAQFVQAGLARIGIRMDIRPLALNQFIETAYNHPAGWQTVSGLTGIGVYPSLDVFASTSSVNAGHYADPRVDALLARLSGEPGRQALFALEDYLAAEQPLLFLPTPRLTLLVSPGLDGAAEAFQSDYAYKLEYLKLSGARACAAGN